MRKNALVSAYQPPTDPTKVMGRRIGAGIVDVVILYAVFLVLFFATAEGVTFEDVDLCGTDSSFSDDSAESGGFCTYEDGFVVYDGTDSTYIEYGGTVLPNVATLAYALLIFVVLQGLTGNTPGKALFGVRTVDEEGEAPGIGRAFIRWILWIVDAIPYCCGIPVVALITAFTSRGHRRVGDMAAKTYVIGKDDVGRPVMVDAAARYAPTNAPATGGTWAPPAAPPVGAPSSPPPGSPEPTTTPTTESGSEPVWDPQRNRYVKWDAPSGQWLEYDDDGGQWRPLSS